MEAAVEGDELVAFCRVAREFHGTFDGFGSGVGEKSFLGFGAGHRVDEFFRKLRQDFVVEICAGHVNQLRRLLLDSLDDLGMTVAG